VEVRPTPGLEQALDALRTQLQAGDEPLNWSEADTLLTPERVEDNFGDDINADDLTAFFEAGAALHQGSPEKLSKLASSPSLRLAGERITSAGVQRLRAGLRQEEDAAADLPRRNGSDHPLG
jgi:hypothetical protein